MSEFSTVTGSDGTTVTSSTESKEQLQAILDPSPEPTEESVSKAAQELGKKGGEATAAKRATEKETSETAEEPTEEEEIAAAEALEKEGKLGKPRHDPRARMLEKAREAKALKAERDAIRAEKDRLAQELAEARRPRQEPPKATEKAVVEDPDPKPVLNDQPYEEWVEATAQWHARREFRRLQEQEAVKRQQESYRETINTRVRSFNERLTKAFEADSGLRGRISPDVIGLQPTFTLAEGQNPDARNVIADEIVSSEQAPALMLHFTEHPEDLQRLAALQTPRDIAREMARLESRLESPAPSAPAKPTLVPSSAKAPVRPVPGSAHAPEGEPGPDASYEAHKAFWNAQDRKARR